MMQASADAAQILAAAEAAFRSGRLEEADALLARLRQRVSPGSATLHLSALVAKQRGRTDEADAFFIEAATLAPGDHQLLANWGNLLSQTGDLDRALQAYARALQFNPAFAPARIGQAIVLQKLGRHAEALAAIDLLAPGQRSGAQAATVRGASLKALGQLEEAAQAFDAALAADPNRVTAMIGRAGIAMHRGEESASSLLRRAASAQPDRPAIQLQLAEALEAEGNPEALRVMANAVRAHPDWPEGQMTLARMRWEAGDTDGFTEAIEARLATMPDQPALWHALTSALAAADRHRAAADAAGRGRQALGGDPQLALTEALQWSEAGELEAAEEAFAAIPPGTPGAASAEARQRLRRGDIGKAQDLIAAALAQSPWDVAAWGLLGIVWRLTSDRRAEWLHGQAGLVAVHELDLDDTAIAAIAGRLRSLHRTRAHPLGQSLRGGTQTRGRLFDRLDPEIGLLRDSIMSVVERHWASMPPVDPAHPLLRHRERRPLFAGSWSVRLTDGGFHVAHIHPQGLLSSACYLSVPDSGAAGDGWLEIGGAPPELDLDLEPLQTCAPVPGRLVLFPSTMFHGTRPFAAGERLTAAFDIVAQ